MINREYFVKKGQAEVLKRLGFPMELAEGFRFTKFPPYLSVNFLEPEGNSYFIPTQSLVQQWLREEKDIYIHILHVFKNGQRWIKPSGFIVDISYKDPSGRFVDIEINNDNSYIYQDFNTYEEALSVAIDKSIEILQNQSIDYYE